MVAAWLRGFDPIEVETGSHLEMRGDAGQEMRDREMRDREMREIVGDTLSRQVKEISVFP
jgi:hypothetical protein